MQAEPFDQDYIIDIWQTDDGLPENSGTAMVQLPNGYLCSGTFGGLVQFDGMKFSALGDPLSPSQHGSAVVNLHLDRSGRLWMSTYEGLAFYQNGQWHRLDATHGWTGDYVRSFAERNNGDLLFTTFEERIFEYSSGLFRELPRPSTAAGGYLGYVDERGQWWAIHHHFIGTWNGQEWTSRIDTPGSGNIGSSRARDGGLWLLLDDQLRKYARGVEQFRMDLSEPLGGFWSMQEDSDGNVWLCTYDRGVCRISPSGEMKRWTSENGLLSDAVRFAFEDSERNMWIGTSGGGLVRMKPRDVFNVGPSEGLPRVTVTSAHVESDGTVLIGTYGKGLFRWNGTTAQCVPIPGFEQHDEVYVQSVMRDRQGRLWVGLLTNGLVLMDENGAQEIDAQQTGGDNIIALFEDSRGRVWISGGQSVAVFEDDRFHTFPREQEQPLYGVYHFAEDHDGDIWLTNGRVVFRQHEEQFVVVRAASGQAIENVTTLMPDRDGSMWLGGHSSLKRFRDGRVDELRDTNWPRSVLAMREDRSGQIWMATPRGILRVHDDHLHACLDTSTPLENYQILDRSDGFTTLDFAGSRQPVAGQDGAGRLWFANQWGVAMLDPDAFRINELPPPMHIQSLAYLATSSSDVGQPDGSGNSSARSLQHSGPFSDVVRMPAGSRRVEIQYVGLNFTAPHKVRYRTLLEGVDVNWQDVGDRRTASYDSLPPGDYTFRVRAANDAGIWNHEGASVAFSIAPFFWQTMWFQAIIIAGAFSSVGGAAWWMGRARTRRHRMIDEHFRFVVEASPNALVAVDRNGMITFANHAAETIFGYEPIELIGRPIESLIPERFRTAHPMLRDGFFQDPHSRAMGAGRELFGRRKDGSEVPIEVTLTVTTTSIGQVMLASILDITERRRSAAETAQRRQEMVHMSRVAMLGELSASLAHELNQPLTAILSNAQAARRYLTRPSPDINELREILNEIVEDDNRASETIRRLRALFRKGELQLESLHPRTLASEVIHLLRAEAISHHVIVTMESDENTPMVRGDRIQLQQVMLNLLLNAFDALNATSSADRHVRVRIDQPDNGFVRLSVIDNGPGLACDISDQVFEPYFTTKRQGLGMGLSISRSIVELHGGQLHAANNADRGAIFWFTMPASTTKAANEDGNG